MSNATMDDLLADRAIWNQRRIAKELDVSEQTVRKWRMSGLEDERLGRSPGPNSLPPSDVPDDVRWYAGTIRAWAMQTGRMGPDGTARRLKPPGRPRGSKSSTEETRDERGRWSASDHNAA